MRSGIAAEGGARVLSVTATQDIAAGQEACIAYVPDRPGAYFLLHYGFV